MKTYTQEELKEILKNHHEWLTTPGGICADLSDADLRRVVPYQTDGKIRASKVQLIKPINRL